MGLDMGFNSKHHSEKGAEKVIHVHANGKKHVHQTTTSTESPGKSHNHSKEVGQSFGHEHFNGKKYVHDEKASNHKTEKSTVNEQYLHNKKWNSESENCCNDKVLKFDQLAKSVVHPLHIIHPVFFTTFVSSFYHIDVSFLSQGTPDIKYFVRSHHPPIPDIRIAIQSFQV